MKLFLLAVPFSIASLLTGCSYDFCQDTLHGNCKIGGSGGGSGSNSTGEMGSSSTGVAPGCVPTEGKVIADSCGYYVKANATGTGTLLDPAGSVALAPSTAQGIYVCGGDKFSGSVTLAASQSVYGGFDCATWTYSDSSPKPELAGDQDAAALTIASAGQHFVDSMRISSPNAMALGGSSIGVFIDTATVTITQADIIAGNGMKGADGTNGGTQASGAPGGAPGASACSSPPSGGAQSATNTCSDGASDGGKGGDGGLTTNMNGNSGSPGDLGTGGPAGLGEVNVGWTCAVGGANGGTDPGNPGTDPPAGAGAAMTEYGQLSSTEFANAPGHDGISGTKGEGGGGGGASKATAGCNGAGGGSGGAGGCGGKLGSGGKGGGSSVGIASHGGTLTLTGVTISLGQGGNGGKGGNGQLGQDGGSAGGGGAAGSGVDKACGGGDGGRGGHGSSAGGGRGGHAIGVVYSGTMAPQGSPTPKVAGTAGKGGAGGTNGLDQATSGADGVVAATQEVTGQ